MSAGTAAAQPAASAFPTKPVRIVVPSAPGGGTDQLARYLAQVLTERWGQTVIVDNRSGGSTTIGTGIVAKSAPDGHTLLVTAVNFAFLPALFSRLPYDVTKDFTPVVMLATSSSLVAVNNNVPVKNVQELIALARSKPGDIRYASGGNGTVGHLVAALFESQAKIKLLHVPYKGTGPSVAALTSGEVQLVIANIASLLPQVRAKRAKALAVTGTSRSALFPELPTVAESGLPAYEYSGWYGLWLPAKASAMLVQRVNADFNAAVKSPQFAERFRELAIEGHGGSAKAFETYLGAELAKWSQVVRENGIKAD
jgi:tripartite-type tricarboxylate transporter receptor subunit TctC